jgi:hypothetical protein
MNRVQRSRWVFFISPRLVLGFGRKAIKPIEHGDSARIFLIKDDGDPGHNVH